MLTRWRRDLIRYQPVLILLLVTVALIFFSFVRTGSAAEDVFYSEFYRPTRFELKLQFTLVIFFVLVAFVFVPIGQHIGRGFTAVTSPLRGYILNILGSLLGVLAFAAISFLQLPPVWWFAGVLVLLLWFVHRDRTALLANAIAGVLVVVAVAMTGAGFVWSPYHKLTLSPLQIDNRTLQLLYGSGDLDPQRATSLPPSVGFHIAVDDDFLQMALNLSRASVDQFPFLRHWQRQYDLPYTIPRFSYDDVLIVGAGTGNDTAAALRHGARRVDAVEIDPAIVNLGKAIHPEKPYSDPRVRVWVDDARSYFNKTSRRYDMVVFGLLDSHRLFSQMSSVRLDSFVFTEESFQEVRGLLKEHGIVVVQHGLGARFVGDRLYKMLTDVFRSPPEVVQVSGLPGLAFMAGPGVSEYLGQVTQHDVDPVDKATDDWPFFYLKRHRLPEEYATALVIMLLISVVGVLGCTGGQVRRVQPHFFFLGSAFLLIETLSVTRFALLFGSTWVVNTIVFTAILVVVLAANVWMTGWKRGNIHLLYALLAAAVLVNFLFPIHLLLRVGLLTRLLVAMALLASPLFFAALIFAQSFKETPAPELAFASNVLGAVVGGLLEYSSLILGFRILLLVALGLYALSYFALLQKGKLPTATAT
jgi:SAM-dependent methyltransferase